jgi:hypothetical protein
MIEISCLNGYAGSCLNLKSKQKVLCIRIYIETEDIGLLASFVHD